MRSHFERERRVGTRPTMRLWSISEKNLGLWVN